MGLGDFISGLFLKEEQKLMRNQDKLEQKVSKAEKVTLSNSDVYALTYFPYDFSKEFAVPLSPKQKDYIHTEIQKWYKIYFEINSAQLLKLVSTKIETEELSKYYHLKIEEFELMLSDVVDKNLPDVVDKILTSYTDEILIHWKPQKGKISFQPDDMEFSLFLGELCDIAQENIYDIIIEQKEDMQELVEIQSSYDSYEQKTKRLTFLIKTYLNFFAEDIMKKSYDRLMTEYYSFPTYVNSKSKIFNNNIFDEFHDTFKCSNFIELFGTVKQHLDAFLKTSRKDDLQTWIKSNQEELFEFIIDYYKNISEDELNHLSFRDLSKYAFSMDCFTVILFKINLDGISKIK